MSVAREPGAFGSFRGDALSHIAFPLGGLGAGMICLSGTGAVTQASIRGVAEVLNEPFFMAAVGILGNVGAAKVVEGPVPPWKPLFPWGRWHSGSGNGAPTRSYGLPRFTDVEFEARFPFARVHLSDPMMPLTAEICGWSPFVPNDEDASSLPVAALEYTFRNESAERAEAVFSFHAANLLSLTELSLKRSDSGPPAFRVTRRDQGFVLRLERSAGNPYAERSFAVEADEAATRVNCRWFRGDSPFDPWVAIWKEVRDGSMPENGPVPDGARPSAGGSVSVPLMLAPGESRTVRLRFAWYVPDTGLSECRELADCGSGCACDPKPEPDAHRAWYTRRFAGVDDVASHWEEQYDALRNRSLAFSDSFYDSTLSAEIVDTVAANLGILKSPTILRQQDGRLWMWEGCFDDAGCCPGSCTHVWNYAQAIAHLFPRLERGLRETELGEAQNESGHQQYRVNLPIGKTPNDFHAASDGQLGGIMKVYREWRVSGDSDWMRSVWPRVRQSLEYCIDTWDPREVGVLEEPHHNTYDIEFWGPDSMTSSCYLGALRAAMLMARFLGEPAGRYERLYEKGREYVESELWNGEYFVQKTRWRELRAEFPPPTPTVWSLGPKTPEALELIEREGPNYQYGDGCLSDGVFGQWLAEVCGIGEILDPRKVEKHLLAVYRFNFRSDLSDWANAIRPSYAFGREGGLLLCTWPRGGEPTLPFVYSFEVWTGIEYQVASHLAMFGYVDEARAIVRTARARYDGRVRNPFDEIECGHWYGRALASWALLQGLSGARYDALDRTLHLTPPVVGDFRSFLSTASGFGTVGVREGAPFIEVADGAIDVAHIAYRPALDRTLEQPTGKGRD